jgi:hypothetical protein
VVGDQGERVEVRNILADVRAIFAGEKGLHWETIAQRLAEQFPQVYSEATGDMIREAIKPFGVTAVDMNVKKVARKGPSRNNPQLSGFKFVDVLWR